MEFNLFGFTIKRNTDKEQLFALDIDKDLANSGVVVTDNEGSYPVGAHDDGLSLDSIEVPIDEKQRIQSYRELALESEIDEALTEIRNEIFIFDAPGKKAFDIDFIDYDDAPSKSIQKKISDEVDELYNVVDFDTNGLEYFNNWYIDGRGFFQKIIDKDRPKKGIRAVRMLQPLNIRKIKRVIKDLNEPGFDLNKIEEYYAYSKSWDNSNYKYGVTNIVDYGTEVQGVRISKDSICFIDSGLVDGNTGKTISWLDKAIKPFNQMKLMEDALVIFRVVRAPSRKAFYIDTGQLQKNKSDEYVKMQMSRFRNKMTYDPKTGALSDRKNVLSMMEDYWLPRREGSAATEIVTLDGQDATGSMDEVEYFRDKLWRALGVPRSRFGDQAQSFVFGKGIEIQRDEYRFKKFLDLLRRNFMELFEDLLKTQLILKNIILESEWEHIRKSFYWTYAEDNAFVEYKESEILNNRIQSLQSIEPYIGKYYSIDWVKKNVLRQTDVEIEQINSEIEKEKAAGDYEGMQQDDEGGDGEGFQQISPAPPTSNNPALGGNEQQGEM